MSDQFHLHFDRISIHGRDTEINTLRSAFERVETLKKPEVIFINGASGSGKTSLAHVLKERGENRYFASGQFDKFVNLPYAGFVDVLTDLCDQVANSDDVHKVRSSLCEALGEEDSILRKALPCIAKIIGEELEKAEPLYNENFAFARLKISFRALLRSVIDTGKTVVLLIDDLHWADQESWELIGNMAQDLDLTQLLLIGSYRDSEVTPEMSENILALSECCEFQNFHLEALDEEKLNDLVASVLKTTADRTLSLSNFIHAKSAGNPHFALQLIKAAVRQNLISYSVTRFWWEWDLEKVKSGTDIADNIVDVFVEKIYCLPADTRTALIIGSCLGSKFDALIIELLLSNIDLPNACHSMTRQQMTCALEFASDEGIVDRQDGSMVYRFAHDKIQQAFYTLVPEIANAEELHLSIGRVLLEHRKVAQPSQDSLTFLTANQLNLGVRLCHAEDAVELAELNLKAAKAAMNASAYRPASGFLFRGLDLLTGDGWSHYNLTLELMILLSRTEGCLGRFQGCHKAVDEVIRNARTIEEKIPVFLVCVDALCAEGRINECIEKGFDFVKQLGVNLPKKCTKLTVIFALIKAKQMFRGKSDAMLLNFPLANDPSKIAAVKIINTMVTVTFFARLIDVMPTLALINCQLILKYGFTDEAGSILACYGTLVAWTGEFKEGHRYGLVALKLAEKSKTGVPRTFMNHYNSLDHLKKPLHQSLTPLLRGYQTGFEVGDTVYGFYCCLFYLSIFYYVGLPLRNLLQDMDSFSKEMKTYNMQTTTDLLSIDHQSVINLTSETELSKPSSLDGRAMTEETILCSQVPLTIESMWFGKLLLGLYFDDYEVVRDCLQNLLHMRTSDLNGCMHFVILLMWTEGLGAIMVAKKTKKRKYRTIAYKRIKKIEKWVKQGNVNCHHFLLHLYAELAVLKKQPLRQVKRLYDSAITASRRAGFTNTAALVNERAALYFLDNNDDEWAALYMTNACGLYDDWGATGKIIQLTRNYGHLLSYAEESSNKGDVTGSTSIAGRSQHSAILGTMHSDGDSVEFSTCSAGSSRELTFGNCEPTFGNLHNSLDTAKGPRGDLRGSSEPSFSAITPESSLRSSRIEEVQIDGGFEGSSAISFMEDSVSSLAKEAALRNSRIEIVQIDEF